MAGLKNLYSKKFSIVVVNNVVGVLSRISVSLSTKATF